MPVRLSLAIYTAIIVIATIPTWGVYMWWGHYQIFPAANLYEVCKVWSAEGFGHVPWFPDSCFGYGYPFLTFYSPLGFYVGAIFHFVFALDYGPATKLSFYASLYLSGLLMYTFVYVIGSREQWPRLAWWALAAGTVYALTRYHLTDIFVRDTIGESWAWTALPGVYLGMEITRRQPAPGILLISLMFAGLLLSHSITALWGTVFIAAYSLLTARDLKGPLTAAAGGILGLALSAFFWYPSLRLVGLTLKAADMTAMWAIPRDLHRQALPWREHFVEALGYGGKGPGTDNTLGANMGLAVLISLLLGSVAIFHRGLTGPQRQRLAVFVSLTFVILFIMSPQMSWGKVPSMLLYVQFPWRLLIFTAFFGTGAAAVATPVIDRWIHPTLLTGLAVIFAIPTLPMILSPPVIKQMPPNQLERWTNRWERAGLYAGTLFQVFSPKWVQGDYRNPKFLAEHVIPENRLTLISGDMACNGYSHSGCTYKYIYTATIDSEAYIAVFYWPGWELRIDGNRDLEGVRLGKDGLLQIRFPAGSHRAELHYNLSSEGKIARVVSTIAATVWAAIFFFWIFSRWLNSESTFPRGKRGMREATRATGP